MTSAHPDWDWTASPNKHNGRKSKWPVIGVIIHYTAGGSREATVRYFSKKYVTWSEKDPKTGKRVQRRAKVSASAHLVIGRDGRVTQMVDFNDRAWHAGDGIEWHGKKRPTNINNFTVGIELCNWGRLEKRGDQFFTWRPRRAGAEKYTTPYTGPEPVLRDGEWWEPYTEAQIEACAGALKVIRDAFPDVPRDNIVGHVDVSPHRKVDPGGAFPWKRVLDAAYPPSPVLDGPSEDPSADETPTTDPSSVEEQAAEPAEPYEPIEETVVAEVVEEDLEVDDVLEQSVVTSPGDRKSPDSLLKTIIEWVLSLFGR